MKLTAEDGKEYEAEKVQVQMMPKADNRWSEFWLLRPIPKTVTIGGVVWEETGEVRRVRYDDPYFDPSGVFRVWPHDFESIDACRILRPLRVEGQ